MSESAPGDPPVATSDVRPPASQGLHHVAYACRDIEATHHFYEDLMGFQLVHTEVETFESGGFFRHTFYDLGDGNCIAFFDLHGVGEKDGWSSAVSKGNGLPVWVNHIAFRATMEQQQAVRDRMDAGGCRAAHGASTTAGATRSTTSTRTGSWSRCAATPRASPATPRALARLFTVTEKATEQKTVTVGGRIVTP